MSVLSHRMVASSLRKRIQEGSLSPGHQVPPEAMLAEEFGVSRQTVRRAFQDLVAEGLVERTRGRGTFVRPVAAGYIRQVGSIDDLMALSFDTMFEVVAPLRRRSASAAADALSAAPSDAASTFNSSQVHSTIS